MAFKNRILRQIFGPMRDANGEWIRLLNDHINSSFRSPNILGVIKSRRLRWAGHVVRMKEILTGKLTGKRLLGRPRRRFEDNIRMDFKEIGINTRD